MARLPRLLYDSDAATAADIAADIGAICPYVVKYPNPAGHADAGSCARTIKVSMEDCSRCHEQCVPRPLSSDTALPARMIKISDNGGDHPAVNLVEFRVREDYICPSHC